ncbi:flavin reductase family protein [Actinomadura macra]|uniref:flavin reductase family protein n=1 Tax=Actinomadura macra TaxID=46164 RepID=UPI000835AB8B|nr:flavin reductase family protein [Actinomadura macra]
MPPTTSPGAPVLNPVDMRRVMGRFTTGVAVITTLDADGDPHGMTVNSLTSVSLDPPMILVCFGARARTALAVAASGRFAVSILAARQEPIARRFAGRGEDHFAGLPLTYGEHDVPVVPDALAHLECAVDRQVTAGDHVVVFGAVQRTCDRDGLPLAFLGGRFGDFAGRGHEPPAWFF